MDTTTCASSPGPARPRGAGSAGANAWEIASQRVQASLGRTYRMTWKRAGTYSSTSVTSSPSADMVPPRWLPPAAREIVTDLRTAMQILLPVKSRQPGTAVIFDMDLSEGTYASAERLHQLFSRVVIVTSRDAIADETSMVTHQGINRRLSAKGIEVKLLSQLVWSDAFENGDLEVAHVYTGEKAVIRDVAFFAYSTPRAPAISLAAPLREAGDPPNRDDYSLDTLIPDTPNKPYDMKELILKVVDEGDFFELSPEWAGNIVIGFGRMNGRSVGFVANQPMVLAGVLDSNASRKAARFVRFCDAFEIPIVTFVDVPGETAELKQRFAARVEKITLLETVTVTPTQVEQLDVQLGVASVQESITVVAQATDVATNSATVSTTFEQKKQPAAKKK